MLTDRKPSLARLGGGLPRPAEPTLVSPQHTSVVAFSQLVKDMRPYFYGVGNSGKIQERLRKLEGVLLVWGPEAKPTLDSNFPMKESGVGGCRKVFGLHSVMGGRERRQI